MEFIFDEARTDFHDGSGHPSAEATLGQVPPGQITLPDILGDLFHSNKYHCMLVAKRKNLKDTYIQLLFTKLKRKFFLL